MASVMGYSLVHRNHNGCLSNYVGSSTLKNEAAYAQVGLLHHRKKVCVM